MAATAHPLASQAAAQVLKDGGTAADALVAAALVLAVVEPYSSGLGGGGFLLYRTASGEVIALDFRERAPWAAGPDLFLRDGKAVPEFSREGSLSVAVPGLPAGLGEIHRRFGKLPLSRLAAPAIGYAREGFAAYPLLLEKIAGRREVLSKFPESARVWLPEGEVPKEGDLIRQPELARALEVFARDGAGPFYKGLVARDLAAYLQEQGGILTGKDLAAYEVYPVEPVRKTFGNWEVISFPPPSSGGVLVLEMLGLYDLAAQGTPPPPLLRRMFAFFYSNNSASPPARAAHPLAEAMRRAYADRSEYLGDPRFSKVPVEALLSETYWKTRMETYDPQRALDVDVDAGTEAQIQEGPHTTHLSIVGPQGDAASATLTINLPFGSGMTLPGWGILLNDEMDDFSAAPGTANAFGLVQGARNSIEGGKTPLSSMAPTMAFQDGKLRLVVGTPGGSRIPSTVLRILLGILRLGESPQGALDAPRIHHQWRPNKVFVEDARGLPGRPVDIQEALTAALEAKGHEVELSPPWCNAQAVWREPDGSLLGLSDERGAGAPAGF